MKQKKQVILIVFGIVLLLSIAGCGKGGDEGFSRADPFLGGSSGLEIKFLKDEPPSEITDNNLFPFKIVLSIKNQGEFDLTNSMVRVDLKGFLHTDFDVSKNQITNQNPEDNPRARKKDSEGNVIEAIETFVTIPSDRNFLLKEGIIRGNTEFTFRADVCYQYETNAISQICILEEMISPADDAICNPREGKGVFSSSSPIKVTAFRQTVVGASKIQFSFDIEHVGSGKVFQSKLPDDTQGCPQGLNERRMEENLVSVTVKTGIADKLSCVTLGTETASGQVSDNVRLVNGKRTITCTQEVDSLGVDLERNVDINVKFDYLDKAERKVLAKHLKDIAGEPQAAQQASSADGGLPTCGAVINGLATSCQTDSCTNLNCDTTSVCTCDSGSNACSGACTTPAGQDLVNPSVGKMEPEFATVRKDANDNTKFVPVNQFFVIQDVSDAGGIKSCTLVNTDSGEETTMTRQGPEGCTDAAYPCDFVGLFGLPGTDMFSVNGVCEDLSGRTTTEILTVIVKNKIETSSQDFTDIDEIDSTRPVIGELVTNVATEGETLKLIVVGVEDPESGIEGCQFVIPGGIDQDRAVPLPYDNNSKGLVRTMNPQGLRPCKGSSKAGNHGPCSFWLTHTFVDKDLKDLGNGESIAQTTNAVIYCTNRKGGQTNPALSKQLPVTISVQ